MIRYTTLNNEHARRLRPLMAAAARVLVTGLATNGWGGRGRVV